MCELISKACDTSIENKKTGKVDKRSIRSAKGVGFGRKKREQKWARVLTPTRTEAHRQTWTHTCTWLEVTRARLRLHYPFLAHPKGWQVGSESWGEVCMLWNWTKWILIPTLFLCICLISCKLLTLSLNFLISKEKERWRAIMTRIS